MNSSQQTSSPKTPQVTRLLSTVTATLLAMTGLFACAEMAETESHSVTEKGYYLSGSLWRTLDIPVCWEDLNQSNAADRALVQYTINDTWGSVIPFNFYGWGQCTFASQGIRIKVADEGPHVVGLGAYIAGRQNGMVLNFTYQNWAQGCASSEGLRQSCFRSTAVHEFGHALGLAHEQNREDTPESCEEHPQGSNGDVTVGEWDLHSVMNYCHPSYTQRYILSEGDKETIRTAYRDITSSNSTAPGKPQEPSVELKRQGRVKFTWQPADQHQTGFEIQRSKKRNGLWRSPITLQTVNGAVKRYIDTPNNGLYRYRVRALNTAGRSRWSSWKRVEVQ